MRKPVVSLVTLMASVIVAGYLVGVNVMERAESLDRKITITDSSGENFEEDLYIVRCGWPFTFYQEVRTKQGLAFDDWFPNDRKIRWAILLGNLVVFLFCTSLFATGFEGLYRILLKRCPVQKR